MKWKRINHESRQIQKIRNRMGDHVSPPDLIIRPKEVKKYLFERNIIKLKIHEAKYAKLLDDGFKQIIKQSIEDSQWD